MDGPSGALTVDVTPATRVTQVAPGQLTDVTVGECVVVRPTKNGGAPPTVTAASVQFRRAQNGQCGQRAGLGKRAVSGTVASITGDVIAVAAPDNGTDTVTVTPSTRYLSRTSVSSSVISSDNA